jgi:hypothetical protein
MTHTNEARPLGAAGPRDCILLASNNGSEHIAPPTKIQPQFSASRNGRRRLWLVPHQPAPRIEVRVSASGHSVPIGRSRAFQIRPHDLAPLFRLAEHLEGRP